MKRLQIPKLIRWAGIVLTLAGMVYFGIDAYSAQTPAAIGQFLTATGALFLILIATESREASATAPADLTRAERANHLDYVYKFWVRDWLEAEIGAEGAIPTGFEALRGDYVLELDGVEQTLGTDEAIFAAFDKVGRERSLLILGEPGGGKTIALLMLARHLLVRAGNDPNMPMPTVFNLSSWGAGGEDTLEKWLEGELGRQYTVPRKQAARWLSARAVMPLLDGLDEVPESRRAKCLDAINAYRRETGLPFVVCCRNEEYGRLGIRADVEGAIRVLPISDERALAYLEAPARDTAVLAEAARADPDLRDLARIPLFLNLMAHAYAGAEAGQISQPDHLGGWRQTILTRYVASQFAEPRRRDPSAKTPYAETDVRRWLAWLAARMEERGQTLFLIERLQPDWLNSPTYRWSLRGIALMIGLANGLLVLRFSSEREYSDLVMILSVLIFVLLTAWLILRDFRAINAHESITWSWKPVFLGLLFVLAGGLLGGSLAWLVSGPTSIPLVRVLLSLALPFGLGAGASGLRANQSNYTAYPNQGIRQSAILSLVVSLLSGLAAAMIAGLTVEPDAGVIPLLRNGLSLGQIMGLIVGGVEVIKHAVLRTLLTHAGHMPANYARFLDYAARLRFLRKVGGGYVFYHDLVRKHFAQMNP